MKTAKELMDEINAANIYSPLWVDDEVDLGGVALVATIDRDEYRWYVVGTVVYQIGDEFVGVRGPISLKSESMSFRDIEMVCEAFQMEAVPSVTYRRIEASVEE